MQRSTRAPVFINTARVDGNVWKLVFYLFLELVVVIKGTSDFCRNGDREETIRRNWRIGKGTFGKAGEKDHGEKIATKRNSETARFKGSHH